MGELAEAERAFEARLLQLKSAELHQDPTELLPLLERCGGVVPGHAEAEMLVRDALSEAKRGVGVPADAPPTLLSFLPTLEDHNTRRVSQGSMKLKTAKARAKNIRQFVGCVGDVALSELRPTHAYEYAESMAGEFGNSTIKTRISDVSGLLGYAVAKGLIDQNPFTGLNLSTYGTRTEHYTPLSDELLFKLFSVPHLPDTVRWIWAILVCTGMRLDEVATLRADQIKVAEGVRHFDLRNAKVKNKSAQRQVPICTTLEPLVEHVLRGKSGREQLFGFKLNADGKTRASAVCTYWMQKAKLSEAPGDTARYTTHSLRGTLKDKWRNARVALEVHNALLGHDQTSVSTSYGRGPASPY